MKKFLMTTVAVALTGSAFAVAPTPTYVGEINIGTVASAPQDVEFYNGDLYVSAITNRKIVKISGANTPGTATFSVFADLSALTYDDASRGPQDINIDASGNLIVWADFGATTGGGYVPVSSAGVVGSRVLPSTASRICSGLFVNATQVVAGRASSSPVQVLDGTTLAQVNISNAPGANDGISAPVRDFVLDGTNLYYTSGQKNVNVVVTGVGGIGKFASFNAASPDLTGQTASLVANVANANGPVGFLGMDLLTVGAEKFLVIPEPSGNAVDFVDVATNTKTTFTDATNLTTGIRGAAVGTISGTTYLFVTRQSGTNPNTVQVYSLGATSVTDWAQY